MSTEPTAELLRVYESIEGSGQALDGEQVIATVHYLMKDVAEIAPASIVEGAVLDPVAGQRNIYGVLRSAQADVLAGYVGARLDLRLEDGRHLHFTVVKNMTGNSCLVQGLNGFRRPG